MEINKIRKVINIEFINSFLEIEAKTYLTNKINIINISSIKTNPCPMKSK